MNSETAKGQPGWWLKKKRKKKDDRSLELMTTTGNSR